MKRYLFDQGKADATTSVGLLLLRLGFGGMMLFGHGIPKLQNFADKKESFPVPSWLDAVLTSEIALLLTIGAEVIAASLIAIGLLTRPAAVILGFTMFAGAFAIHASDPLFIGQGAAKEPALLYLIPCVVLIITGAGRLSVDHSIRK